MAPIMYAVGQKVRHAKFGVGVVKQVGANGALLKVYFSSIDDLLPVTASDVQPEAPAAGSLVSPPPSSPPPPARAAVTGPPAPDLRRLTVECLRQGLPPPGKLTSWTVGHTKARKRIDAAIASAVDGEGSVLFARAPYGQGKSHIGRLGRELAREHGLATFHVELDGDGLSLAQGTRLIASLFASARLPAATGDQEHLVPGLATILKRAAPAARSGIPKGLGLFAPFLKDPQRWCESEEIIEVLEAYLSGYRNKIDSEEALREHLHARMELESFKMDWGAAEDRRRRQAEQLGRIIQLAMMAGAKGAFIVLDELDHDFQDDLGKKYLMLNELARVVLKGPIVLLLLARELELEGADELELGGFTKPELEQLVDKTIDAFAAAHPAPVFSKGRPELFASLHRLYADEYQETGWGPRFFVRAAIESCEAARYRKFQTLAEVVV